MSNFLGLLGEPPIPPKRSLSPLRILTILVILIFATEMVAMMITYNIEIPSYLLMSLLDGIIMVVLILPGLYFLQLRPLLREINERTRVESALRQSEKLLWKVLELLPVGVLITDKDGNIVHGNPASHRIWSGLRHLGVEQYGEYKGWWPDTGMRVAPDEWAINRAINQGQTVLNEEIEIESFDGVRKTILNSAVPILSEGNSVQGVIIVNQDITQIRQKEKDLIQTNELLEKFFLSIDTNIAYLDRQFNFIRVNDTYANRAGHTPKYFIGKNHFELYPHAENQAIFQNVVDTGQPYIVYEKPFEYPEFPEQGVTYWDWGLHPVKGPSGEVEGLALSLVEVTERKQAELQLERQNEELRELTNAERKNRELAESLVQATITVNKSLELNQVLSSILEQIRIAIGFHGAGIMLSEDHCIRVAGYLGFEGHPEGVKALERFCTLEDNWLLQQVLASLQPLLIPTTREHSQWTSIAGLEWVGSFQATPLIIGSQVTGVIILTSEVPGAYNQEDVNHLMAFAAPAALAIHNAQLFKAEQTARQTSETLRSAVQALSQTLDLNHVINTLLEHLQLVIPADTAGVTLLRDEIHRETHTQRDYKPWTQGRNIPSFPLDGITDSVIHRMISSRRSLQVPSLDLSPTKSDQGKVIGITHWLLIPMIASDKMIGYVEVGQGGNEAFNPEHTRWAEAMVSQAGVSIQNAWLFEQVRTSSERLQSLARKLVEVQENERVHIARELHDEAGQALSSLKLSLGRLEHDPDCPERLRQRLLDLKDMADGVLENLHRLAMDLRPAALDHLGLIAALEQYINKLCSDQLSIEFKAIGFGYERLPTTLETSLYRVVQEAVTNTIRYAQASNIGILLERKHGLVRVFVEDDGIGFDHENVQTGEHIGLVGMRERAEMLGGTLTIESTPGRGTSIIMEVPDGDSNLDRG
jgi:PAS domain S-box-containing protein